MLELLRRVPTGTGEGRMGEPAKGLPASVLAYLVRCRKASKLTQENVAERMSIHHRTVQYWEGAQTEPSLENLMVLCDVVHADIREVQRLYLGREKPAKPPLHLSSLNDAETLEEFEAIIDARAREDNRALIATVKTGLRWLFGPGGPRD